MDKGRVILAGGSGFIGRALTREFEANGYAVRTLTRSAHASEEPGAVYWDGQTVGEWRTCLEGSAAVVNLSGTPVSQHWNDTNKLNILESRLQSTNAIGAAIQQCSAPPQAWINMSGVSYYGNRGDEVLDESSEPGPKGDFLVDTAVAWEHAQFSTNTPGTRQVRLRTGPVIGKGGGFMQPLTNLTRWFLGGHVGTGHQYMSWIHLRDLCSLIRWCVETDAEGAFNATSPNPETNARFMYVLRSAMKRPWAPPVPALALKVVAAFGGPDASLLLDSQRALPKRATERGFNFVHPDLVSAIAELLG